ncbi:MAG: flagellar biosynthesis protein FliQ [Spirochaetales bacterium]|nr:flagellar biosynthesis protein FliQ [Treponema sp.]MDD5928289.1 flagellar biosynthesis protein FliQ [Spirochaetales bacterium]
MSIGLIISLMRGAVTQVITMVAPVLGLALVVGLIVAIFQATTSIQEQTLTFLPKLLVILLVIALLGGAMFTSLGEYTIALFNRIPDIAK